MRKKHLYCLLIVLSLSAFVFSQPPSFEIAPSPGPTIQNTNVVPASGQPSTIFNITTQVSDVSGIALVIAHIQHPDETNIASVGLFDDGVHSDVEANDGTYGNGWDSSGWSAGVYYIDINATDTLGYPAEDENGANFALTITTTTSTTTTTTLVCQLTSVQLNTSNCYNTGMDPDTCCGGDQIYVNVTYSGNCEYVDYIQVDLNDSNTDGLDCYICDYSPGPSCDGYCESYYGVDSLGDIDGLTFPVTCTGIFGGTCTGSTNLLGSAGDPVPAADCLEESVNPWAAGAYSLASPCDGGTWVNSTNNIDYPGAVTGAMYFGSIAECGGMSTTSTTVTATSTSVTTTTISGTLEFKVELYGDYNTLLKYSRIRLDGGIIPLGWACQSGCTQCSSWDTGLTTTIDTSSYCGDGQLAVTFEDSYWVSCCCNSNHRACIDDGGWHCCEEQCSAVGGCTNTVTFNCADWSCVET